SAGNPAHEAFPIEAVKEITADIMANDPITALQYSLTEGYTPLRETMENLCRTRYGINMSNNELLIVSGAQQGIELACKVLCNENDSIICENPSFIGSLNSFRSYGVNLIGVKQEQDGMNMDMLEKTLREAENVKLIYVIPNFQNPTGNTMSLQKRKDLYRLACEYNVVIIEDNPYGELRFDGNDIPNIKSFDIEGRVIYVGSFSKILSPGLRVGYVVLNKELSGKFVVAKQCSDVHTAILNQMICQKFITEYDLDEHIAKLRTLYKERSSLMLNLLDKYFSKKVTFTRPEGGLFIWCTMPQGTDTMGFCSEAIDKYGVAVVPGNAFNCDVNAGSDCFRINFSSPSKQNIIKGCERLGKLTKEWFEY
ncbi:MAG: PLP-dependent aminotransferase family protein, partial [Christensenella sp.]